MSVPRGADVDPQWTELSWGCPRSCWWRPPGGVRSQQKKAKIPECSDSKGRKPPINTEMHLPESSELQIRYFQCSTRDTISLKHPHTRRRPESAMAMSVKSAVSGPHAWLPASTGSVLHDHRPQFDQVVLIYFPSSA